MTLRWTTDQIPNLSGKIAVVTGANRGIGYETAFALAQKGATVILAVRDLHKGQLAEENIKNQIPEAKVITKYLDLNDLNSVRAFSSDYKSNYRLLDILINNAGIMAPKLRLTKDGFESQFGVNYLGHFALTGLLLEPLKSTPKSRVVSVGSMITHKAKLEFGNFRGSKNYKMLKYYSMSKLACMFFAKELQNQFKLHKINTKSIACHPGVANTNLFSTFSGKVISKISNYGLKFVGQDAKMGALPILYAATEPSIEGGAYIGPSQNKGRKGYPKEIDKLDDLFDENVSANLWNVSEKLSGITYKF